MRKLLMAVALMLCLLMAAAGASAELAGLNYVFDGIESEWGEDGNATPVPAPMTAPADGAAPMPSPEPTPSPSPTPEPTPEPEEQEVFDQELYDAPVPAAAYNKKLYILDPEKELLPAASWLGDERYGVGEMKIPQLFQFNYRKVICFYRGTPKSVATSGCGATSMSMVIAFLTGNKVQSPYTLFRWAVNNDMYDGSGLEHEVLQAIGANYGVGGMWIKPDETAVKYALKMGHPVIAHMGKGRFTDNGHYIVLRGLTDTGKIRITDPNSFVNSLGTYTYQEILKEVRTADPFMICYREKSETE